MSNLIKDLHLFKPSPEKRIQPQPICKGIQSTMNKIDDLMTKHPHLSFKEIAELSNFTQESKPINFTEL